MNEVMNGEAARGAEGSSGSANRSSQDAAGLPPAEHWWPKLSVEAKHALLENLQAPLGESILQEIALITERSRFVGAVHLSDDDRQYILTQIEPVD